MFCVIDGCSGWLVGVKSVDRLMRTGCRVFWVVDTVIWWFARCSG